MVLSDPRNTKPAHKAERENLTCLVSFQLTDADHKAYIEKVEASGLKPSPFFRDCVLTNKTQIIARSQSIIEKARLLDLFSKANDPINPHAHRANCGHESGTRSDATYLSVLDALDELSPDMKDIQAGCSDVGGGGNFCVSMRSLQAVSGCFGRSPAIAPSGRFWFLVTRTQVMGLAPIFFSGILLGRR